MQLSLGVFVAFLLLLPGFGLYGAFFARIGRQKLGPIPPKAGSVLTLFIIAFGALTAHLILALVLSLNALWCKLTGLCFKVGWGADFYQSLSGLSGQNLSAGTILGVLFIDLLLFFVLFCLGHVLVKAKPTKAAISRLRYGALSDLMMEIEPVNRYVTAFVVTKIQRDCKTQDDDLVGYEGLVGDITYDKSEIQAIHLTNCTPFYMRKSKAGLEKILMKSHQGNIPYLYFPKDEIRNLAFTVYEETEA